MRILLLAPHPFYQHRGTPIAVGLLVEALGTAGHEIHILTYHEGKDIQLPNTIIHRIPRLRGIQSIKPGFSSKKLICDLVMFVFFIRLVRRYAFDIVHAVEEAAFMPLFLKPLLKIPYVYDMDSSLPLQMQEKFQFLNSFSKLLGLFEQSAVRHAVGVIAVCKELEDIARKHQKYENVLLLQDISLLSQYRTPTDFSKDICSNRSIIMYVGNLEVYQGIDLLLESFSMLTKSHTPASLVIIGGSKDDIEKYQCLSKELGIADHTFFMGPRPISQLSSLFEEADVLVSPRIIGNNTPMKIYSYLESGKPVVATRLKTHTQVLDDRICYLAPPNPADFSSVLKQVIEYPESTQHIVSNARKFITEHHSLDVFRKKLLTFYDAVEGSINSANSRFFTV